MGGSMDKRDMKKYFSKFLHHGTYQEECTV
jgi:NADPH-dependent 7-cyano-7-deazaguanine reductase QueF